VTDVQPIAHMAAPLQHGGDLAAARRLFPGAPEPFVDLSTGINPHSYPVPQLPSAAFCRLPEPAALKHLAAVAAAAYGAPSRDHVVPAPGTQILLVPAAAFVAPGRAAVLAPTYAEFVRAAALAGHHATEVRSLGDLMDADLAIVANPNNPDGRLIDRPDLLRVANALRRRGGLLMVDETFMDAAPGVSSLAGDIESGNILVLRSFGKFFGLAGLRLGFALATPPLAARLAAALGPWAVSGPAIAVGALALADRAWVAATRVRLVHEARRLDSVLAGARLDIVGGTPLFRLVRKKGNLFGHLGYAGIWVRRFVDMPDWLRIGLPAREDEWQRLAASLATFPG
jgi:cobalamin biosynthesis protein CobC